MEKPNETMGMIAALLAFAILFLLPMLALAFLIECIVLPHLSPIAQQGAHMNEELNELNSPSGSNLPDTECPSCHNTNVNDEWVYVCQCCGRETCPDCAGRCGCEIDDEDQNKKDNHE